MSGIALRADRTPRRAASLRRGLRRCRCALTREQRQVNRATRQPLSLRQADHCSHASRILGGINESLFLERSGPDACPGPFRCRSNDRVVTTFADSGAVALEAIIVASIVVPAVILAVVCWIFYRAKEREEEAEDLVRQRPDR
jgi:hypothetical protein